MFLGTHHPKLDEKGRFFLPAKFRDQLAEGLVIVRTQDRCLAIYPREGFDKVTQGLETASMTVKQVRDYARMLGAGSSEDAPDKQGRVTIPPTLRQYASLDKDIVVIGAVSRIEIWDAQAWEQYSTEQEQSFAELNEEVFMGL